MAHKAEPVDTTEIVGGLGLNDISAHNLIMFAYEAQAVREASWVNTDNATLCGYYTKSLSAAAQEVAIKHGLCQEAANFIFGWIFHSWNEINYYGGAHTLTPEQK